ncbi:MAG: sel1 repeat family protein, partial [Muribaculaceae bacterium]|nr:sel1 repeat family protein [Muribaculaceae bacterium]
TMLHCLTGVLPVKSNDWTPGEPAATINALPVSERLRTVIKRAMSLSRFDRYADAGAMSAALGAEAAPAQSVGTIPIEIAEPKIVKPVEEPKTTEETRIAEPLKPSYEHKVVEVEEGEEKTPVYKRKGLWIALAAAALVVLVVAWPKGPSEAEIREQIRLEQEAAEQQRVSNLLTQANNYYNSGNYSQALPLYKEYYQASNNASAATFIGYMYRMGQGTAQDYAEAVRWFLKAAEGGNPDGMYNLGYMYREGRGVAQDYAEAVRWYRKAIAAGSINAMTNLGFMYEKGYGVAQSWTEAIRLYTEAAQGGDEVGMYNLGNCYRYGQGVAQDREQAIYWYRKAAEKGDQDAKTKLREMGVSVN